MIMRRTVREMSRFGIVGVSASAAHIAVALLLIERLTLPVLWANALAFSVALFVSYFGNHHWTFQRDGAHGRHFPRFLATALGGLALEPAAQLPHVGDARAVVLRHDRARQRDLQQPDRGEEGGVRERQATDEAAERAAREPPCRSFRPPIR